MYRGINSINFDAKGRVTIPTRHRERLLKTCSGNMVVTIDTEVPCLLLYPLMEWEIIEEKISALSSFNRATRRIQRLLIGHATETDMDSQGRLLIPAPLREYGGFVKQAVLVGQGKKFELWDEAQWAQSRDDWLAEEANEKAQMPDELQQLSL